ncbi:hypothetical protein A3K71_06240 [archaeon RBG_16_50_20]|nr:MAG: hypothetical protein A3K71_06240 [archaeon RBG_16_50_20]
MNDVQIPSPVQSNLDKELPSRLIPNETPVTYEHPQQVTQLALPQLVQLDARLMITETPTVMVCS